MKDTILAAQVAAYLLANTELIALVPSIKIAGQLTDPPSIVLNGEYMPYGQFRKGILSLDLRSAMGDESADPHNHAAYFNLLFVALFGAFSADPATAAANLAAAKLATQTALAEAGKVQLIDYGPARDAIASDSQDNQLQTILKVNVVWKFLAA